MMVRQGRTLEGRVSSSPRSSRPSPSSSWKMLGSLGAAFGESEPGLGDSPCAAAPRSPLRMHRVGDDDAFFVSSSPTPLGRPSHDAHGSELSHHDASVRHAWHRMRFMSLDDAPPAADEPVFRPSVLGPPLPKSRSGSRDGGASPIRISAKLRTPRGSLGSAGSRSRLATGRRGSGSPGDDDPNSIDLGGDGDGDQFADAAELGSFGISILRTSSPQPHRASGDGDSGALVATPPETPRRCTGVPTTPPRARAATTPAATTPAAVASAGAQYTLPRSPATPHLGRPAEIMRAEGSPMTRSPGCRSLSSLT